MYRAQGDWDGVIQAGLAAMQEYPRLVDLAVELGWAYYQRGDGFEIAEQVFINAITQDERRPEAYFALGQLLNREGRYQEADEWFMQAVQRDSDNKWYLLSRGNNLRSLGDPVGAILVYQDLIAKFPDYAQAYFELAAAYLHDQQLEQAAAAIDRALALQETPDEWYFGRAGAIYEALGDYAQAESYYRRALEINPGNRPSLEGLERVKDR